MIDERAQWLIHAELDGEIDVSGRAELDDRLRASTEARALREDLRAIAQALARLPQLPVPADPLALLSAAEASAPMTPARNRRGHGQAVPTFSALPGNTGQGRQIHHRHAFTSKGRTMKKS
jgi:anti-sigma factor RsiW